LSLGRYLAPFVILTAASPALAQSGQTSQTRVAVASILIRQAALAVSEASSQAADELLENAGESVVELDPEAMGPDASATSFDTTGEADSGEPDEAAPAEASKPAFDKSWYKAVLGELVITLDLQIPGVPTAMALRLIPTTSALGGASAPIVLRPRVVGTDWVGLDIAGRF
jgi:hypothetical protein